MKLEQLVSIIENMVHQPTELEFDKIGVIQPTSTNIDQVGVCVDLTDHVMQQIYEHGINFLVVHHGHGEEVRKKVRELGIGAYGLHLALDTAEGGLIDSFADLLNLSDVQPLTFKYKDHSVPKGAVLGNVNDNVIHYGQLTLVLNNGSPYAKLNRIVVSTGPAI